MMFNTMRDTTVSYSLLFHHSQSSHIEPLTNSSTFLAQPSQWHRIELWRLLTLQRSQVENYDGQNAPHWRAAEDGSTLGVPVDGSDTPALGGGLLRCFLATAPARDPAPVA